MTLFESADERYAWLNNSVCISEGVINPETGVIHIEVNLCERARVARTSLGAGIVAAWASSKSSSKTASLDWR